MEKKLDELMSKLDYEFKDRDLLRQSLMHRSYGNEHVEYKHINNERLEFLGDAVLDLVTTEYLFTHFQDLNEGEMAKMKSTIISEAIFTTISDEIGVGDYLYLSHGEELTGGRQRKSILGDTFESVIGAIFIDSNFETAKEVALKFLKIKIENLESLEILKDYKTNLQELFQKNYHVIPEYVTIYEKGPDHDKVFKMGVKLNDEIVGVGKGKSKKEAEKLAAKEAFELLESNEI